MIPLVDVRLDAHRPQDAVQALAGGGRLPAAVADVDRAVHVHPDDAVPVQVDVEAVRARVAHGLPLALLPRRRHLLGHRSHRLPPAPSIGVVLSYSSRLPCQGFIFSILWG